MSLSRKRVLETLAMHQENGRMLASATFLDGYWNSETNAWDAAPARTSEAFDQQHAADVATIKALVGDMISQLAAQVTASNAGIDAANEAAAQSNAVALQAVQERDEARELAKRYIADYAELIEHASNLEAQLAAARAPEAEEPA